MNETKEVYFYQYCKTCEYFEIPETEDPCNECLANPSNMCSHKPTNWKEKEK